MRCSRGSCQAAGWGPARRRGATAAGARRSTPSSVTAPPSGPAADQLRERRLAAARRPDERGDGAGAHRERAPLEHRLLGARRVREVDVAQPHLAAQKGRGGVDRRAGERRDRGRADDQRVEACYRVGYLRRVVRQKRELADALADLPRELDEGEQRRRVEVAARRELPRVRRAERHRAVGEELEPASHTLWKRRARCSSAHSAPTRSSYTAASRASAPYACTVSSSPSAVDACCVAAALAAAVRRCIPRSWRWATEAKKAIGGTSSSTSAVSRVEIRESWAIEPQMPPSAETSDASECEAPLASRCGRERELRRRAALADEREVLVEHRGEELLEPPLRPVAREQQQYDPATKAPDRADHAQQRRPAHRAGARRAQQRRRPGDRDGDRRRREREQRAREEEPEAEQLIGSSTRRARQCARRRRDLGRAGRVGGVRRGSGRRPIGWSGCGRRLERGLVRGDARAEATGSAGALAASGGGDAGDANAAAAAAAGGERTRGGRNAAGGARPRRVHAAAGRDGLRVASLRAECGRRSIILRRSGGRVRGRQSCGRSAVNTPL